MACRTAMLFLTNFAASGLSATSVRLSMNEKVSLVKMVIETVWNFAPDAFC